MERFGKCLMVYFAFVLAVAGIAIALPHSNEAALLGAPIASIGLTYFWYHRRPTI